MPSKKSTKAKRTRRQRGGFYGASGAIIEGSGGPAGMRWGTGAEVPAPAVINTSDEYDGNAEYEVLRGLVAQFPSMGRDELMSKWMGMLNLKRRTSNLIERFEDYLRKAKKELR